MTRWNTGMVSALMALSMGLGSVAQAQPGHDMEPAGQARKHGRQHDERRDHGRAERHEHRGAGPEHRWVRGSRVPPQYRTPHYVINDWRGHHLSAPPRGYHWIQSGGDYLLVAIATGVIASMVLSAY
ncbi:RcnB family protein [Comamonas composti]|uniref:RcnB family protein n=1 Tax=Comamonas composti TaxID=408558 RepID=UPI000479A940|nr:RcnB family protein [Comamonas composti]